ncbi:Adenine nucleotide alpha hydrolases-like superfamily protein isoform 2 [Hibiscus syriacus]|uniref:Adenine nucleotide alpha hydrolases-like superfamily protein isoform 2 n=1 Tax=Hibiscus syriacus TaxID=106335 RepID=A0A6A2X5I6_HIBSY|nr:Adenine nucleotide alpha hydrolases-like superfamily protein isoform 2 [Hibiscus syriacus]
MVMTMEDEEYNYREVILPSLIPVVPEPALERETVERRRGRDIVIAVDHGPKSKHAFDWALIHLVRLADTIHLVHAVSSVRNDIVYETSQALMEKLAVEAFEVAMQGIVDVYHSRCNFLFSVCESTARIVEGDAGKVICKEAERLKPAAVVMGTRGRSLIQSVLQGSVSEYCFHNCKAAPVIIVPGKEAGDESLI